MTRIITLIILAGLWMPLTAQKIAPALSTEVLARVGESVITAKDLIERVELMPWPEKERPDRRDSAKVKALNSLVAERLLAIEGKLQKVGSDEAARARLQAMEKLFVRDELYKREVRQKITVSEEEIRDGLAKFAWQLHVTSIAVKDEQAADSLYRMLRRNPAQAAALKAFPAHLVTAVETVQVNFGGLDTAFENNAYAIGRKKFSKPFQCPTYGWTIAMLQDRGTNPVAEKMSAGDRRYRVDEMIRNAKEAPIGRRFIASVLVSQKATVDSVAFELLAAALHAIISKDPEGHYRKGAYGLTAEDFDVVQGALANDLQRLFVRMNDRPMTLGEGLEALRHLRLGFPSLDAKKFKGALNGHVRFVVETELLAREGYRRNLQHAESVKRDVDIWSNYWSSRYLRWNVDDSVRVSHEELLEAVKDRAADLGRGYEVRIQEVLCDSLTTAARVLDAYAQGAPLADIARRYTKRGEWRAAGGVSPFMALTVHTDLTHRAFLADTGAIVGPVKVAEGYSLFRVLAKRKTGARGYPAADTAIITMKNNLTEAKRNRAMSGYVAGLAKQYTVDIKYEKLKAVKIQPANMYTRRNIGFGGVVTAAPVLAPNWEWVKDYRDGGNIIP